MVISGQGLTFYNVHFWQLYGADPLGDQAADTLTQYSTQSHYLDSKLTSPHRILVMPSARLGR